MVENTTTSSSAQDAGHSYSSLRNVLRELFPLGGARLTRPPLADRITDEQVTIHCGNDEIECYRFDDAEETLRELARDAFC